VQNLFVARPVIGPFTDRLLEAVGALRAGDPMDEGVALGPMISEAAARRVESWVAEAVAGGARPLAGGTREGAVMAPTVLADVRPEMRIAREEVFGPVIALRAFDDVDAPVDWVNASGFGLHCGLFTDSTATALRVARRLSCGGLIVNGPSSFRTEQVPYGGLHRSGLGREGPARAVEDMTEERLLVFNG
jgi:acyl-CoA reductase-like NAD-dependent aldehyde dehydrogenase